MQKGFPSHRSRRSQCAWPRSQLLSMFIVCSIARITIWEFTKEVWPFLLALCLALLVVTYVPQTVLYLPNLLSN